MPSESCRVDSFPDDQQWRSFGVPPYSKFIGTEWLGGVDGGLLVDKFEEERGKYYEYSTVIMIVACLVCMFLLI